MKGVKMKTYPVTSSNIQSVSYDLEKQELTITFHGGSKYLYKDIKPETVCNLIFADSIGSQFHKTIKHMAATKL